MRRTRAPARPAQRGVVPLRARRRPRRAIARAADRAARLLAELAGGTRRAGRRRGARRRARRAPPRIALRVERTNRLLGLALAPAEVVRAARARGRRGARARARACSLRGAEPPQRSRRAPGPDRGGRAHPRLRQHPDHAAGRRELAPARIPERHRIAERARDLLAGAGPDRGGDASRSSPRPRLAGAAARRGRPAPPTRCGCATRSRTRSALLRTTLVPSLLRAVAPEPRAPGRPRCGLFEVAGAFCPDPRPRGPGEARCRASRSGPCGVVTERREAELWGGPRPRPGLLPRPRASRKRLCPGWVTWHRSRRGAARAVPPPGRSRRAPGRRSAVVGASASSIPRRARGLRHRAGRARCSS